MVENHSTHRTSPPTEATAGAILTKYSIATRAIRAPTREVVLVPCVSPARADLNSQEFVEEVPLSKV